MAASDRIRLQVVESTASDAKVTTYDAWTADGPWQWWHDHPSMLMKFRFYVEADPSFVAMYLLESDGTLLTEDTNGDEVKRGYWSRSGNNVELTWVQDEQGRPSYRVEKFTRIAHTSILEKRDQVQNSLLIPWHENLEGPKYRTDLLLHANYWRSLPFES